MTNARAFMRKDSDGHNFKRYHKPIIYVSMGTVFNNENPHLFEVLIRAATRFSPNYAVIVSTGDERTYAKYVNTSLASPDILLIPHTPQIDILKRAALFITHAGMNSVSEAINYGVPIICLPLSGDQPFVAWRVADELGIGIRLQPNEATLTVEKVVQAIEQVLMNKSYREKAQQLAAISKSYSGHKSAAEHTVQFVHDNETNHYRADFAPSSSITGCSLSSNSSWSSTEYLKSTFADKISFFFNRWKRTNSMAFTV